MAWRVRDYYRRFNEGDTFIRVVAVIGLALVLVLALQRFLPVATSGIDCLGLPSPTDFNNQSILTRQIASDTTSTPLRLDVVPDQTNMQIGQLLGLNIRMVNDSMGPLTLYLIPGSAVFRFTKEEVGLVIFMERLGEGRALGENAQKSPPVPIVNTYQITDLHLLGPRQRCTFRVEIDGQRLQTAGVNAAGQYRIRVVYRNLRAGQLPAAQPGATVSNFPDQGAYVGEVQSNDVFLNIGAVTTAK